MRYRAVISCSGCDGDDSDNNCYSIFPSEEESTFDTREEAEQFGDAYIDQCGLWDYEVIEIA